MSDDQFSKLLQRFDEIEKRLEQQDDQFARLYQHTEKRFDEVGDGFKQVDQKLDRLYTTLDGIAKHLDDDDTERAATNRQLSRHEAWHHQLADNAGLKLDYDAAA